jgi:hypothetical protein
MINSNQLPIKKYYSSVCLIVKNDHDLLPEWLEHYRRLGFDHIYLIDNGTTPPHREKLQGLIDSGYLTYMYATQYPFQVQGYNYVLNQFRNETIWLAYFDSDEFLVLKKHANINDFLREYEDYAAVSVVWYLFGSSGHLTHQSNTIESYNKRVRHGDFENGQYHFKSIIMTDRTTFFICHHGEYISGYTAVDETKTPTNGPFPKEIHTNSIQLNHYVIRSLEDFQEKSKRRSGDGWVKNIDYFYITDRHANEEYDWTIIERHYPEYIYRKIEVEREIKRKEETELIENIVQQLMEEMANNR